MPPTALLEHTAVERLTELLEREVDPRLLPLGVQDPTHVLVPRRDFSHGEDACELAEICGYDLLPFQRQGLVDKLGIRMELQRDGSRVERWAAVETVDVCSRRNGKSLEIEILILAGLFILGEQLIMYTAHRDDTAKAVFDRVVAAISRTPALWAEVVDSGPRRANGQREIKLKSGQTVIFRTRTLDTARGEGFDRLILDEAQNLTQEHMAAIMPVISGNPNSQLNYAGSAGGLASTVLASLWRSFEAGEGKLYYRGWHADPELKFDSVANVARMNPALGYHLTYDRVAKEFKRMTHAQFGRERMGVALYPREKGAEWVIPEAAYRRSIDETSAAAGPISMVLEADPDLETGTICIAGRRADGRMHVEVVRHFPGLGVGWMLDEAIELAAKHDAKLWLDPKGPLGFMLGDFAERDQEVHEFTTEQVVAAFSWFTVGMDPRQAPDAEKDAPIAEPRITHRGPAYLEQALASAQTRKLMGRLAFQRFVEVPQGPLIGCCLAGYAVVLSERDEKAPPPAPETISEDRSGLGPMTSVQW